MSATSPKFLQKTALDVLITYSNPTLQQPIPLNEGTGIANIMDVDTPDNVEYEKTATGDTSVAIMAVVVTGKLHLHPASPALQAIQTVAANQLKIPPVIVPGTITVKLPSSGQSYAFNNVIISSPFKGLNISKVVDDYVYTFKADLPDVTSLNALSTIGLVNLV